MFTYKKHPSSITIAKKAGDRAGQVIQPTVKQADIGLTIICHLF